MAGGALTASGNLAGWAVERTTTGPVGRQLWSARCNRHRRMRIDQAAGVAMRCARWWRGFLRRRLRGPRSGRAERSARQAAARGFWSRREIGHRAADPAGVAAASFKQRALEIAGDLDVHRGAKRGVRFARCIDAVVQARARISFALVATTSLSIGKPMRIAASPAKTSPKLPVGTTKVGGASELRRRGEVVDRLRRDAGEVDRVDGGEVDGLANAFIGEQRLHDGLRVVERSLRARCCGRWRAATSSSAGAALR